LVKEGGLWIISKGDNEVEKFKELPELVSNRNERSNGRTIKVWNVQRARIR